MVQTSEAQSQVLSAVALILINDPGWAREHWWSLARLLHQPLLTLSLMPESAYGSDAAGASLVQLRKWQLQQLGAILRDIDEASCSDDPAALSTALESRVVPGCKDWKPRSNFGTRHWQSNPQPTNCAGVSRLLQSTIERLGEWTCTVDFLDTLRPPAQSAHAIARMCCPAQVGLGMTPSKGTPGLDIS